MCTAFRLRFLPCFRRKHPATAKVGAILGLHIHYYILIANKVMATAAGTSAASIATRTIKVLAISGSLRKASTNSGLIRFVTETHPATMEVTAADISDLPLFNADLFDSEGNPPAAAAMLRKQIGESPTLSYQW